MVLAIHGWTSEMARYPERIAPLIEMGWIGVLFDMRGHGETGGKLKTLSVKDHHEDCLAAYDYIKNIEYADTENMPYLVPVTAGTKLVCWLQKDRLSI